MNKIIKILLTLQLGLFFTNVCNYLMLLNTEFYKYFLLKNNKTDSDVLQMFNTTWNFNKLLTVLIFVLTFCIVIIQFMQFLKKKDKE